MTAEPRDVEEIRADIADLAGVLDDLAGVCSTQGRIDARAIRNSIRTRLAADVEPLLDRLAAADRENAELRGEVERISAAWAQVLQQKQLQDNEHLFDANAWIRERDDLHAQLAAAQAQLAKHRDAMVGHMHRADAAEARLEAVRAAMNHPDVRCLCGHESALHAEGGERRCTETAERTSWHCPCRTFHPISIPARLLAAALSAAPQPESTWCRDEVEGNCLPPEDGCCKDPEPPASDDAERFALFAEGAAKAQHAEWEREQFERAASDEPARCEHGKTFAHGSHTDMTLDPYCPGPAASGTPDGGGS